MLEYVFEDGNVNEALKIVERKDVRTRKIMLVMNDLET